MAPVGVQVVGLKEFRRSIAHLPEVKTELRNDMLTVGKKIAADAATHVPSKTGRARSTIRVGVSGNQAYVAGGKQRVPYYGWLDFGSRTAKTGQPRSVGPWAKTGAGPKQGRYLYPAIERNTKAIKKAALAAFDRIGNRK